eukprot:945070_1
MILYYNQVRSAKRDETDQGPAKRDDYMLVQMIWVILILIWVLFMVQLLYFYYQMMKILVNMWINHAQHFYIINIKSISYCALSWISNILHHQYHIHIVLFIMIASWQKLKMILALKKKIQKFRFLNVNGKYGFNIQVI